jgi:transcriptional regulator with XRE-family HTH domain
MANGSMSTPHQGKNVKRIREILGIKQDALARDLGISQQAISSLEQKEALEKDMLEKIAQAMKVSPEMIKNFDEEKTIYNIQNNYEGSNNSGANINYQCTINPVEKLSEALAEIKQLHEETKKLYERLLQSEKEKVAILEKVIGNK